LFKRAEDRQSNFDRYQTAAMIQQERCCVFLDEVVRFTVLCVIKKKICCD